jgi:hypothetical protein
VTKPPEFHDRDDNDAHAKFQQWRRQHFEDGYFLNYKGPNNTMLHRSLCWHHGDANWKRNEEWGSLTAYKKVCSTDRGELEQWARNNGVQMLKQCQHCT